MDLEGRSAAASTLPEQGRGRRADVITRRLALALLVVIVVLAATGVLGVRSTVAREAGSDLGLAVHHASVARPGLAAPFEIEVEFSDAAPVERQVEVSVDLDYLAIFDENGWSPEPEGTTVVDGDTLVLEYVVPAGERSLVVVFDARIEPSVQAATHGATVGAATGGARVETDIRTVVLP